MPHTKVGIGSIPQIWDRLNLQLTNDLSVVRGRHTTAKQRLATLPAVAFEGSHVEAAFITLALEKGGVTGRVVNHLPK